MACAFQLDKLYKSKRYEEGFFCDDDDPADYGERV